MSKRFVAIDTINGIDEGFETFDSLEEVKQYLAEEWQISNNPSGVSDGIYILDIEKKRIVNFDIDIEYKVFVTFDHEWK